jgi:hypothetical protein
MVPTNSEEDIYCIIRATVNEGMLSDLKALQLEMSSATMSSDHGCLAYEWYFRLMKSLVTSMSVSVIVVPFWLMSPGHTLPTRSGSFSA